MNCRFCSQKLNHVLIDLVNSPPSNSYLKREQLNEPEVYFPLKIYVCESCFLVQVDEYKKSSDIFNSEYAYFSSYSSTWLEHAKKYTEMMIERFQLTGTSKVTEIASNDGYLLQYFKEKHIVVLGIEPTENTAKISRDKGITTIIDFFSSRLAESLAIQNNKSDVLLGNNVLAHVPDINDFVEGLKIALKEKGVITMEFPHLLKLLEECQFDTIYHEHFSYLSFYTVGKIFEKHGLEMFDVEELATHGGSLRIFAKHISNKNIAISPNVALLLEKEKERGLRDINFYKNFQEKAEKIKHDLLTFLITNKLNNKKVIAYGAAAKGNTLLNYCGLKGTDLIHFVVDASPHKQNKYLPGSHIPVVNKEEIARNKPDYVLILPWNIKEEIMKEFDFIKEWGGKFVTSIPFLQIY
jgi:2-polyprenyl-3-methyl-5-hydroxy-6-metoxy-1,4-benzoquinol methylase